jgi:hypothetical protein
MLKDQGSISAWSTFSGHNMNLSSPCQECEPYQAALQYTQHTGNASTDWCACLWFLLEGPRQHPLLTSTISLAWALPFETSKR